MKKFMLYTVLLACLIWMPVGVRAYTITDVVPDSIGYPTFETYGINVSDIYNPSGFVIDLFTNLSPAGTTIGSWFTPPADLFMKETYHGNQYEWAIPTVTHDGFNAGTMYAVGSFFTSDHFDPSPGSYTYNHNVPVEIATMGSNYGYSFFSGGSIQYLGPNASMPYYQYRITPGFYQDDPNGSFSFLWGTATCANDVITGQVPSSVPEPSGLLLLGCGILGIGFIPRRKKE